MNASFGQPFVENATYLPSSISVALEQKTGGGGTFSPTKATFFLFVTTTAPTSPMKPTLPLPNLNMATMLEQQAIIQMEYNSKLIDLFTKLEETEREMTIPEREASPCILPDEFRNLSQYKRKVSPLEMRSPRTKSPLGFFELN
ncbi:hypothetical protein BASA81_004750 [Batrachochytrium salamandrivorans]|nr:hypothetical protein BASA81_004750 [Batrachochytrium salamandrivorans]